MLTLLFAAGQRPDARALERLAMPASSPDTGIPGLGFSVTHRSDPAEGWAELLVQGLAFDCSGLAGAAAAPRPRIAACFGVARAAIGETVEPVAVRPGPHLAGSEGLRPVVRSLAGLGARLSCLPGLIALCWEPARSAMAPDYYARTVDDWLGGGTFPALGLTSLERSGNGAVCSQGLAFLTGQDLIVEADDRRSPGDQARIAVRLAHEMVESGPVDTARDIVGLDGAMLRAEPEDRGRIVRLRWC